MGYPTDIELPLEVRREIASIETVVRGALSKAVEDCPHVERVAVKVDVLLKPFNFPINLTITSTGD